MASAGEDAASQIMVFRPTLAEFSDFSRYITHIEGQGAHQYGIVKVVPPKEWRARSRYEASGLNKLTVRQPISQVVSGGQGLYQLLNMQKKSMSFSTYKELASSERHRPPQNASVDEMERKYWKNITFNPPLYGADVPGTLYDLDVCEWNINHLDTILDTITEDYGTKIPGVNSAYLYFGMWRASFAWHTEDMDLYSINYVHFGAPKLWYAIPPAHAARLDRLACGFFPEASAQCSAFLRHKMTIISPNVLRKYSIPVNRMVQNAGEFIVTFPRGYHSGFNLGFNCAESTNFAMPRWIDFGRTATVCECHQDRVKINMDAFVEKYQPEEWSQYCYKKYGRRPSECQSNSSSSAVEEEGEREEDEGEELKEEQKEGEEEEEGERMTRRKRRKLSEPGVVHPLEAWPAMWCKSMWDFPLESTINELMGHLWSCCVCAVYRKDRPLLEVAPAAVRRLKEVHAAAQKGLRRSPRKRAGKEGDARGRDNVVTCKQCCVTVHTKCYGVDAEDVGSDWSCLRCKEKALKAECCVCAVRGGVLQQVEDGVGGSGRRWIHVLCARLPESGCHQDNDKQSCCLCRKPGRCLNCSHDDCDKAFHMTCALLCGLWVEPRHGKAACPNHPREGRERSRAFKFHVGEMAALKAKGRKSIPVIVKGAEEELVYEVIFDDGSLCRNLLKQYILEPGTLRIGQQVQVEWTDGLTYSSKVLGWKAEDVYQVQLNDGTEETAFESDFV